MFWHSRAYSRNADGGDFFNKATSKSQPNAIKAREYSSLCGGTKTLNCTGCDSDCSQYPVEFCFRRVLQYSTCDQRCAVAKYKYGRQIAGSQKNPVLFFFLRWHFSKLRKIRKSKFYPPLAALLCVACFPMLIHRVCRQVRVRGHRNLASLVAVLSLN